MNLDVSRQFFGPSTRFWIMAGTYGSIGTDDAAAIETLGESDPRGPRYTTQVDSIKRLLSTYVPNNGINVFTYTRQHEEKIREKGGAWGKAAVSSH